MEKCPTFVTAKPRKVVLVEIQRTVPPEARGGLLRAGTLKTPGIAPDGETGATDHGDAHAQETEAFHPPQADWESLTEGEEGEARERALTAHQKN